MRILFMGSGDIALPSLRWLIQSPAHDVIGVVTQPDKPIGRHQILTTSAIKQAALNAQIPVFQPVKIREPENQRTFNALEPDSVVVMAYGQILPKVLLDLPKVACLNLHASLLPRHRGASPIQSAILAGDEKTGITLMHMDVGLDTGDIVIAHEITIEPTDTGGTLHDKLADLGPSVLDEGLALFTEKRAQRQPQDATLVTHSKKLDRDSGRIDWNSAASFIERQIRAMNPWPGSFLLLPNGKKLKVFSSRVASDSGQPGEILRADSELVIGTESGSIALLEVQLEGRSRLSAPEFLRGNPLAVHEILPFRA